MTLGGYPGKRVELSLPDGLDIATCDNGVFTRWSERGTLGGHVYRMATNVVYILDVEGLTVVIDTSYLPGTTEETVGELDELAGSVRFEPQRPMTTASPTPTS